MFQSRVLFLDVKCVFLIALLTVLHFYSVFFILAGKRLASGKITKNTVHYGLRPISGDVSCTVDLSYIDCASCMLRKHLRWKKDLKLECQGEELDSCPLGHTEVRIKDHSTSYTQKVRDNKTMSNREQ